MATTMPSDCQMVITENFRKLSQSPVSRPRHRQFFHILHPSSTTFSVQLSKLNSAASYYF